MSILDRRRFLCSAATAATIGSVVGTGVSGERRAPTQTQWEWVDSGRTYSALADSLHVDDGYLFVGTVRDGTDPSEGLAMKCDPSGAIDWTRRYASPDQEEGLEQDPQMGPIPQDGFSFALPAGNENGDGDDGYLLVGWTYYDNTAVYVGRLVRVGPSGRVQWERSFTDLEDASAYSYLADGIRTDDGYLLCGMESPGIMLGGAGWLVSVTDDGSVNWHRRYPATDRDLEQTGRRDVFTSITQFDDEFVLSGYYDPDDDGTNARAWTVGLDDSAEVRWDDRFDLAVDGPTRAYDVARSESDAYDFLVVGAAGPSVRLGDRDHSHPHDPGVEGDGFVAAYTVDGERVWLQDRDDTPMFTATSGDRGVVCGGSHDGRGWVGTLERTDFEADDECAVTSLCDAHDGELVASGRRISSDRTEGWARLVDGLETDSEGTDDGDGEDDTRDAEDADGDESKADDSDPEDAGDSDDSNGDGDGKDNDDSDPNSNSDEDPEDPDEDDTDTDGDPGERTIEFVDCQTVRVVGDFEDVILGLAFQAPDGDLGTIQEPVGGVDGERTIHGPSAFDVGTEAAVVTYAEGFDETPATPGLGTVSTENPTLEECEQEHLGELVDGGEGDEVADGGTIEFLDCETARVTGTFEDVMLHLTWWSAEGLPGTISEPVGSVDGERTINATEEFGPFEHGPVLNSVELFDETPSTPGLGVQSAQHPNQAACEEEITAGLEADGGGAEADSSEDGAAEAGDDTGGASAEGGEGQTEAESETGTEAETQTEQATADSTEEPAEGGSDSEADDGSDGEADDDEQGETQDADQSHETESEPESTPTPTDDGSETSDGESAADD
ncbi:hypothetical protein [Natronoglomus mannanivorans]|uniref:MSCRAMM family adhesin SdrC n=1 Tax=Natronoglomus mannanivorans TaxID=2979990 RepID=A0AAP2Z1T4_9EURY|nr:MSCRAMM family adhesin SdrC [Halobacteria archaeon AArc-xg1-1]